MLRSFANHLKVGKTAQSPLEGLAGSIAVAQNLRPFGKLLAWLGPGFMVSVGYMDPGNWATDLAGGAQYGYALLWVVLASSLIAMFLQALAARLAIATGTDLASACRMAFPKPVAMALWLLAELAIIATDLAEVLGTAIGIQLLFGLPLLDGVLLTMLDVFVLLGLQRFGFRKLESFVMALLILIFSSFLVQVLLARPDWAAAAHGLLPSTAPLHDSAMLYLALGIIGATIMPHNLYMHSGIVLTRQTGATEAERRDSLRYALWDSNLALGFAFLVNAALLILAAAVFNAAGHTDVAELADAHRLLAPLLGTTLAPKLFALALLACGLNSALTATLSGQIIMEGFVNLRLAPWARRLFTRLLAILPALAAILWWGESGTSNLLIASQVVLALQLPFAVVPLVAFSVSRHRMGSFVLGKGQAALAIVIALGLIALNLKLAYDSLWG